MESIQITPERKAQLAEYARRHGRDMATALDEALAEYLEWEEQDYSEAVSGIRRGLEDVRHGLVKPLDQVLERLQSEHGLQG